MNPNLILSFNYTNEIKINIYQGSHGKYYNIEDNTEENKLHPLPTINYDIHFPLYWIFDEKTYYDDEAEPQLTGPINCKYCRLYGHYKGAFIGYCARCAEQFNWLRGCGFLIAPDQEPGKEIKTYLKTTCHGDTFILDHNKEDSMWETYLKGITLDKIGDEHIESNYYNLKNLEKEKENDNNFKYNYNNFIKEMEEIIKEQEKEEEEEYELYKDLPDLISENNSDSDLDNECWKNFDEQNERDDFEYERLKEMEEYELQKEMYEEEEREREREERDN
jgi:hypothetical protein